MLTHGAAAFNLDGYTGYAGAIMQWYQQTQGAGSAMDRLQEIYNVYHQNDASFTMADALEEFTAEATAGLFSSEEGANDFVSWLQNESGYTAEQKKTVLQKVAELFGKIVDRIRELLRDGQISDVAADFAAAQAVKAAQLRQMFLDVLDGMEIAEGSTEEQREAKYSIKYPKFSESEIEENKKTLARMDAVYHVSKEKLQKTGRRPSDLFREEFSKWGNNIYSERFGDITLSNSSVKSEIRHGVTAEKLASIEAIPTVIQKGEVIFSNNKTGTDVERLVICAPITIADEAYYMGVMLQRDKENQRLYLHNVVLEKEMSSESQANLLTTGALDSNDHLFITNILQDALNVKRNLMQETATEEKFSLRMAEDQEKIRQSLGMRAKVDQSTLEANTEFDSVERDLRRQVRAQAAEIRRLKAGGHAVDLNAVRKSAIALRSEYASGIKVDKLQQMMADAFDTILNEPELTQDAIDATLQPIAEAVLNESKYKQPEISEDSRAVLDDIKSVGIVLSDAQKEEMAYRYGSYGAFYRKSMGVLKIRNDGVPLDQRWKELSETDAAIEKTAHLGGFSHFIWKISFTGP